MRDSSFIHFQQFLRFIWLIIILNYTTIYRLYWTILKENKDWKINEKEYKINEKKIQKEIRLILVVQDKKNHKIIVKRKILKKNWITRDKLKGKTILNEKIKIVIKIKDKMKNKR